MEVTRIETLPPHIQRLIREARVAHTAVEAAKTQLEIRKEALKQWLHEHHVHDALVDDEKFTYVVSNQPNFSKDLFKKNLLEAGVKPSVVDDCAKRAFKAPTEKHTLTLFSKSKKGNE